MVKKGLYILLIGMLISGVALFSGCRRHSHGHKAEFMVDYISEALDLNENQQAQLDQIKDELMAKAKGMHADKESLHEELVTQLRSEEIDQVRVKAVIAEHREKMDEIIDLVVVRLAEFHKTLTAEQKEKLIAKIETFKKWHHRDLE
ncbi:MAG: Spy/CpxP family protein refolding chaperone [Desulfobacterales bacterium]|jgi:Spy/CpxP family protein refolding chaperone